MRFLTNFSVKSNVSLKFVGTAKEKSELVHMTATIF